MASAPFSGVSTTETLRCSGAVPPRPVLVSAAHVQKGTVNVQLPGPATPCSTMLPPQAVATTSREPGSPETPKRIGSKHARPPWNREWSAVIRDP